MRRWEVLRGINKLVQLCAGVRKGEQALIVTDTQFPGHIPDLFALAVTALGAEPVLVKMLTRKHNGEEPPAPIAAAMKEADVVFELSSMFVHHSQARQEAHRRGARYLYLGGITDDLLAGPGAMEADFEAIAPRVEKIAQLITASEEIELTAPGGTRFRASLHGREGRALTGLARTPGSFGAPPDIETGVIPVEGTSEGTIVADAYAVEIGLLSNPIRVEVEKGRVRTIEGLGTEAERLRRLLEAVGNPNAYQIAEIGIGLNPQAEMIDNILSAEGKAGTAHIALGSTPGDRDARLIQAGIHLDLVFWHPDILLDGISVVRNGEVII
jgi:leucyl aminopeptidase (aminopeptidase T)